METAALRPAIEQDFVPILAINQAGRPGVSPLTAAELATIYAGSPFLGVADIDGTIAGYVITYTDEDDYDGEEFNWFRRNYTRFLYIDQIAIAPAARRAGLGGRLYRSLEQRARDQMLASLVCEVNLDPPNEMSLDFHTRQRFVEVGTMATSDGRTVSLRRKDLADRSEE